MSATGVPSICVRVDPPNPGQFFASCGLLEIADRLWAGAEGWFEDDTFRIRAGEGCTLAKLLDEFKRSIARAASKPPEAGDADDGGEAVDPIALDLPSSLVLDWWSDKALKTWAGSMDARAIFGAMAGAIDSACQDPFHDQRVVFDPARGAKGRMKEEKKREPFYFDARRGESARSVDIGFAPDAVKMRTIACPAVEALCFVGLQRFRPTPVPERSRTFDYCTWPVPLPIEVAPAAACGALAVPGLTFFRFTNIFRTDQRKHKAFSAATQLARRS
jgi:hypothetical protein